MNLRGLLELTAAKAADFLDDLETRPVAPTASLVQLREALGGPMPGAGLDPERVIDDLVRAVEPGLMASAGGRFFGWVIGGTHPAALAADWLTSAWDQNAAIAATSPAAAIAEEVCGGWLKELLGIPPRSSFALVTGSQMAHVTALAAARNGLLSQLGWDVERRGLAGAPPVHVIVSELRHESLERAARLLGFGTDSITRVPTEPSGSIHMKAVAEALDRRDDGPTILCLQAGELNSGAFDPFAAACSLARQKGAWTHVDGAFGLWTAASPRLRHLLAGIEQADSWVTDGHKWLNTPFDIGFAFVAHPEAHRAAMTTRATYFAHEVAGRDAIDWNPEWSRRARGFAVYAALRSMGSREIAELVDRCVHHAKQLVAKISVFQDVEVLAEPVINQGLLRFLSRDGDHDRRTDAVIARVQESGDAWFGGTTWRGARAMRVSVCSWRTSDTDVQRAVAAVRTALVATP